MEEQKISVDQVILLAKNVLESLNVTDEDMQQDIYLMAISEYRSFKYISATAISNFITDSVRDMIKPKNKNNTFANIKMPNSILSDDIKVEVRKLINAIEKLDTVHKFVITNLYGIRVEPITIEDISNKLGCSVDRSKTLHIEALEQLKKLI